MDEKEKNTIAVSDFSSFLLRKGYRDRFTINHSELTVPLKRGDLSECLESILQKVNGNKTDGLKCELRTHPPYNDNLECVLKVDFDQVKGFLIREMKITDSISKESRNYRITSNQQIPGAMSGSGLFPKPKPWDDHLKGRFRI